MPVNLDNLLPHLPVWLMVLFRLLGIFVMAPLLGSLLIPARIKVFWAVAMSLCIYPVLLDRQPTAAMIGPFLDSGFSLGSLATMVALETALGLLLGLGATLPLVGLQMAGMIVDQQIGLGLAGVFNPDLNEESGAVAQFYFILAMWIFLILGGHRVMISALLASFERVPLGGMVIDGHVLDLLVGLLSSMFELALRVAAPLLCLIFLETVAIGFIARTVPQLNILSVGFPLRILAGLGILIVALSTHAEVFARAVHDNLQTLLRFFAP